MATARKRHPEPAPNARQMREDLKLSRERMGRLVGVSAKTIERWEETDSLPANRALLDRLTKIQGIVKLGQVIYTPEGFRRYVAMPLAAFDGHTALQLIEIGQTERVLSALAADYEGLGY